MKKKLMITLSILAGIAMLGIGIYHSGASPVNPDFSRDEIRKKVEAQYPGSISALELKKDVNDAIYEVVLETNDKSYLIEIDGITGEVTAMEERNRISENKTDESDKSGTEENKQNSPTDKEQKENKDSKKAVIGSEKAKEIALGEFQGTVVELELDEDDDRFIYEIQIEKQEDEADIEIDAYTGEVILVDIDKDD